MSRITAVILILFALLIPSAAVVVWFYSQRVLPTTDGIVTVPSLDHPVEVRYDERGVPYIQGKNEHDIYLAQGYVTASDRMFQMDILRRTANGELADIFGQGSLDHDKLVREMGLNRLAQQEYKQLPDDLKMELQAYCKGINDYIDSANGKMPIEFLLLGMQPRQWQPADSLAILKYLQYEEEESWQLDDLRQRILDKAGDKFAALLFEENLKGTSVGDQPDALDSKKARLVSQLHSLLNPPGVMPRPLPIWGSNAWAVGGSMSDSKGCILAYDSHSAFTSPDRYYICSLATTGMHVAGATVPGVPGILAGRNEFVCWGSTLLRADTQDLVLEQLAPQFPGKYRTTSGWDTMKERSEEIPVRFGHSFSLKTLSTKHGPVVLQNETTAVSLAWTGYETKEPVLKTLFQLNRAKNWKDFNGALSSYSGSPRTFMYADKQGNFGFHVAGAIPVRTTAGATVSAGWTDAADWHGRIKYDDLPHGYNPSQGYAVADNPQFVPTIYYNNPLRAIRIGTILGGYKQSNHPIGLPEMALLQGDVTASLAPLVKKELEQTVARAQVIDEFQASALAAMRQWDGTLAADSASATIYQAFLRTLTTRILEPKIGAKMTQEYLQRWPRWSLLSQKILTTRPKEWLPPEERTYDTFIITTFAQALKNIRTASKTEDATKCAWQSLHQIHFRPILTVEGTLSKVSNLLFGVTDVGVGGDQDTVNACNVVASSDPFDFSCDSGPTYRQLADMSDQDKFYSSLPLGQSEHIFSPYRTDELRNWLHLEPHSIAFSATQLDKQQQHKVIFTNQ